MPTVNLIGPGRLGRTLGRLIAQSSAFQLLGIHGPEQLDEALAFIGGGIPHENLNTLPPADIWLLGVPDGAISEVAIALAKHGIVAAGSVVAHCSGAASAELLAPLRQQGALTASLHPVYSFADPARAVAGFAGTPCALEGDATACARLEPLVAAVGGHPFRLNPGSKAAYHAALCVASNYLVTLAGLAEDCAALAGLDSAQARPLINGLMQQTLSNIACLGPQAALTGPIVRGDQQTVASHLSALAKQPALLPPYQALGRATLLLAQEQLPDHARQALYKLLSPNT